jgi:hypothetical protein
MAKSKAMCSGCREDFYNHNQPDGCWCFAGAKIVTRMCVGTWQPPPYVWRPEEVLSCFSPEGSSMIKRNDCRVVTERAKE